jgi:hypothetical protein
VTYVLPTSPDDAEPAGRDRLSSLLPPDRAAAARAAFAAIQPEIDKLRALDLREVHPAVVFSARPAGAAEEAE